MPLTRIDSAFLDLDAIGGIDFDVNNNIPTFKVDAVNHRVGIGHNSPTQKLHVVGNFNLEGKIIAGDEIGNSNISNALDLTSTSGVDAFRPINLIDSSGVIKIARVHNSFGGGLDIVQWDSTISNVLSRSLIVAEGGQLQLLNETEGGDIVLEAKPTGGSRTEHLRITSTGNVGIGTDNPQEQLDVRGTTNIHNELKVVLDSTYNSSKNVARIINLGFSGITGARNWALRGVYQYAAGVNYNADGGDLDLIKSLDGNTILATKRDNSRLGKVGIGTDNPREKLHVSGTSDFVVDTDSSILRFGSYGEYDIALTTGRNTESGSSRLYIENGDGETLRITSGGNVGINNTTPDKALDINSDGIAGFVRVTGARTNSAGNNAFFVGRSSRGTIASPATLVANDIIATFSSQAHDGSNYLPSGRVRFGVDSVSTGNVGSNIQFIVSNNGEYEAMRIASTGNVGIGTDNPSSPLHLQSTSTNQNLLTISANNGRHAHVRSPQVSDLNSPFTFFTNNSWGFDIDSIRVLTMTHDYKVGVGTDAPTEPFHIWSNSSTVKALIESTANNSYPTLRLKNDARIYDLQIDGASDSFRIYDSTGSSERLTITSTGQTKVTGADDQDNFIVDAVNTQFVIHQDATDGEVSLRAQDGSGNNYVKYITFFTEDGSGPSEKLRIDSVGDLGVGITDPKTKLHVARVIMATGATPQIRFNANDSDLNDNDRTILGQATGSANFVNTATDNDTVLRGTATGNLLFGIGTAEKVRIASSGNVGINDTNPSQKLNVGGNIMLEGDDQFMYLSNVGTGNAGIYVRGNSQSASSSNHFLRSHSTGKFTWEVTGSEKMCLTQSGELGIGIVTPGAKLHVESAATTAGWQIRTDSIGLSNESGFYRDASDHYEVVIRNGLGGLSYIKNDGGASTANLRFNVQGSESLTISSSGNVGIGTNNPGYKLDVRNGPAYFDKGIRLGRLQNADINSRTNVESGFWDVNIATTANGWPVAGNWLHVLTNTHSNTTNYYSQQFVSNFFNQELYFRNTNSGTTTTSQSWGQVMHTNSILKPVYAESSGNTDAYSRYWYPGGEYYVSVHGITAPGAMNDMIEQGYYHVANNTANNPGSAYGYLNVHRHAGSHYSWQTFVPSGNTDVMYMRASFPDVMSSSGRSWYPWSTYGSLQRENTFLNRQHIIGPSSTSTFTGLVANTNANRAQFVLHSAYSDLVISSAQTNDNHGSTLSFVTSNPSNAATYNKFVINKGNYGTRNQFLEFGYQSTAHLNPHNYVNSTYTMLTLDGANQRVGIGAGARTPSFPLDVRFSGDSGIHAKSSDSHSSLWLDAASGNGGYIRFRQGGSDKFWVTNDSSNHLNFRPNGGSTTVRIKNGGQLDAFNGLYVTGSMNLGNIELDFTTNNNKYVDFYCNTNQTAHLRVVNGTSFHHAVTMTRGGKTAIWFNNGEKLYTTNTGAYVNGTLGQSSDANLKENIITVPNALDKVKAMRGVKFNWREDGRADYGVIAQEAETVVPELVSENESKKLTQAGALKKRPDESDYITTTQKGFSYNSMVGILIEAIKEQQATIDSLTARIDALENP